MGKDTIRLLLVEDNEYDAETIRRMLGKYEPTNFQLEWVRSTTECVERLKGGTFDLVLLDYSLPSEDGVSFLRRLDTDSAMPPVIMLTGWGDARVASEALQRGAYDYFPKSSIDSEILAHAIHQAMEKSRWEKEQKRLRDELERLAVTDELTGLHNRRYLTQSLHRECARAKRYGRELSTLMIDLDDFKKCNDIYGHLVGDMALKQVATVIKESVRDTDIVVRYGGEEFVVIMPESPGHAAMLAAERIRSSLSTRPIVISHQSLRITVSVGICAPSRGHVLEAEAILACADGALHRAKAAGKNRIFECHSSPQAIS